MHQIIYTSSATQAASDDDFRYIARHANQNNRTLDITGLMLYSDGVILQVLEGEKQIVETLYDRIKRDERHSSVMKLISREIEAREFPEWSIGLSQNIDTENVDGAFALTKRNLAKVMPTEPSTELKVLTDTYIRVGSL